MTTDMDTPSVADLHQAVRELTRRIDRLETARGPAHIEPVPADVVLAISAAVAAYLGKRAPIRQVRFTRPTAWAQQGRAALQASHDVRHRLR